MRKTDLLGYSVEMDENATRAWYAKSEGWGCDCGHCRNFLALAERKALPAPVMDVLSRLEIPPEKATYVCEMYPDGDGYCYQFSYRIAGRILAEAGDKTHPWGEGRCCHEPYPHGAPGFPEPHFDLEFWVTLPWVLEESQNG